MGDRPVVGEQRVAPGEAAEGRGVRASDDLIELLVLEHDHHDSVEARDHLPGLGATGPGGGDARDRDSRREGYRQDAGDRHPQTGGIHRRAGVS